MVEVVSFVGFIVRNVFYFLSKIRCVLLYNLVIWNEINDDGIFLIYSVCNFYLLVIIFDVR